MANFWEKVKQTLEESTKAVKEGAESVAKSVGEKAPQIASSIAVKSKEFAATVSDKTQDMVSLGQLKYKHYQLHREVSHQFTELGERAYDLIKNDKEDIYADSNIKNIMTEVSRLEQEIAELEKEMEQEDDTTEKKDEGKSD
jgi:hypothetical protein